MRPFICEVTESNGEIRHLDTLADSAEDAVKVVEAGLEPGAEVTDVFDEAAEDSDPRIPLRPDMEIGRVRLWQGEEKPSAVKLVASDVKLPHGGKVR